MFPTVAPDVAPEVVPEILPPSFSGSAEVLTPYPPRIPAALPGERLNLELLRHLRGGIDTGMVVPDAADTAVKSVRAVVED